MEAKLARLSALADQADASIRERDRLIVELHDVDGVSLRQIAKAGGLSAPGVAKILRRVAAADETKP